MAKAAKVRPIFVSFTKETPAFRGFRLDNEKEVWLIVGDGDVTVSLTANEDVGHFTTGNAIMAFQQPDNVPESLSGKRSRIMQGFWISMPLRAIRLRLSVSHGTKPKRDGKKDSIPVGMLTFAHLFLQMLFIR